MEDIGWFVGIIGVLVTILIFILNMFRTKAEKNEEQIKVVKEDLDGHKLHTAKEYSTKDEMIKMIGLISAPIQKAVDDVREEFKDFKENQKEEDRRKHEKLDQLLANQAHRRKDD